MALSLWVLWFWPLTTHLSNQSAVYTSFYYPLLVLGLLLATGVYFYLDYLWQKNPPSLAWLLKLVGAISLILIFVFPFGASDLFFYLAQARTFAIHHLNPYFHTYGQLSGDAFYPFLRSNPWIDYTSSYGPLFNLLTGFLASFFRDNFVATIILFKSFLALFHIINTLIINKVCGRRWAWLYALNPLILFEFIINSHNEVLLIFFTLLSFHFLWKRTPNLKNSLFSISFLTLAILTKFVPVILLPLWGLVSLWRLKDKKEKIVFVVLSALAMTGIGFLAYLPFWQGPEIILNPIFNQIRFASHLLASPLITLSYGILLMVGNANPWSTALLIGQATFGGYLLIISGKIVWQRKNLNLVKVINYGTGTMLVFYAVFLPWITPWYFTFLLLLLLISHYLSGQEKYLRLLYLLTILGSLYYLILR